MVYPSIISNYMRRVDFGLLVVNLVRVVKMG